MTLRVLGAAMVLTGLTTSLAHADSDIPENVLRVASDSGRDPIDLLGAVYTTGLDPLTYICRADGLLCPDEAHAQVPSQHTRLADCIIAHESRGNPNAVNPVTKAAGLGQFLGSTWRTTPQGKAGYSVFDPVANRNAVEYMIAAGRAHEFVGLQGC